ncbi:hypothetical protein ACFS5L_42625 [Streptomyces phyllanthi]|uniref:hypothetical protein n=1 Tax=Streptomyces phyllanthi TaxID=1803180 RepID=UPI0031F0662E
MLDLIVRALAWVLNTFLPTPPGRHRAGNTPPPHIVPPPPRFTERLDGAASALVRPYVLTPHERRHQRARRRALCLAALGTDTGPSHIHGVRVGAAR